jgi:23S rRNA pseudouridine1911/1915/1917 synthase
VKTEPEIAAETASFIVVYKPPRMHSAPLVENPVPPDSSADGTLLDFAAGIYPEVRAVRGWKPVEGGLVHRLDYETRGLLLIARTQAAMDALRGQQEHNRIVKEYTAVSAGRGEALPGFPPYDFRDDQAIESAFRPYGKGRKTVRPVLPGAGVSVYRTEIVSRAENSRGPGRKPEHVFRLRICRGYRHQIRCHLAWAGWPIVNDSLYGGLVENAISGLALTAGAIFFTDPETGRPAAYSLDV